ncbi:MAG: universal stress protein [Candidatus Sulfotelmatobacter sp.]|jgi:nucleotide-binding universal stress UspA family protein
MSTTAQIPSQKSIAFKHVLMATDFSEASQRALHFAIAIARRHGSMLSVMHAIPAEPHDRIPIGPLPRELDRRRLEAESQLSLLEEQAPFKDLQHELLLERGDAWEVLASEIQGEKIDLLILGTRGRGGLKKLALGSVAEQVLHLASCPVLTIGPNVPQPAPDTAEFKRILFATDFGIASNAALPYALSLAEDYRAKLFLLHMVPPMPASGFGPAMYGPSAYAAEEFTTWQRTMRSESVRKLKEMIPPQTKLEVEPEYLAGMDFLPEGILETTAAHSIDLIVMGVNHTSVPRVAAHIPWALTHEVLCHAKCPVLTMCN